MIYIQSILDGFEKYADIFTAGATVGGFLLALSGVGTWKNQLRIEIARKYLRAAYKVREALKDVRNPFISVGEMERSRKEYEKESKFSDDMTEHQKMNLAVYEIRWKKVREARAELEAEALEAEALWGSEAAEKKEPLIRSVNKLFVELKNFTNPYEGYKANHGLIYERWGEPDSFSAEVDSDIKIIEVYLRPHLK